MGTRFLAQSLWSQTAPNFAALATLLSAYRMWHFPDFVQFRTTHADDSAISG